MLAFFTILIALFGVGCVLWAVLVQRDVFHPLAILMPMVLYLYVYLPYELISAGFLSQIPFTAEQLALAQGINLLCILGLGGGCIWMNRGRRGNRRGLEGRVGALPVRMPESGLSLSALLATLQTRITLRRLYRLAIVLGSLSSVAFVLNVNNVGGLFEAYSVEKGGGTAESGYQRDVVFWAIPAIAILAYCGANDGIRRRYVVPGLIFAAPLLIHGLLGARRGPTFMIIATLAISWFLARGRRPSPALYLGGSAALGLLLLAIVTFREQFRIGSQLMTSTGEAIDGMLEQYDENRLSSMERTLGGNEWVYGTNVMLTFAERDDFFWGTRLLTILFIRPIPRQLWETKYEDVGMERYLVNVGLGNADENLMWTSYGAAPGFVGDLFAEFSWGAILASWLVGAAYGRAWRAAVEGAGLGLILYILLVAVSLFFVMQTLESFLYRMLFTSVPVLIGWKLLAARVPQLPLTVGSGLTARQRVA